jgi:hypothetical protein
MDADRQVERRRQALVEGLALRSRTTTQLDDRSRRSQLASGAVVEPARSRAGIRRRLHGTGAARNSSFGALIVIPNRNADDKIDVFYVTSTAR